jgi:hypothetical protein
LRRDIRREERVNCGWLLNFNQTLLSHSDIFNINRRNIHNRHGRTDKAKTQKNNTLQTTPPQIHVTVTFPPPLTPTTQSPITIFESPPPTDTPEERKKETAARKEGEREKSRKDKDKQYSFFITKTRITLKSSPNTKD